MESSSEREKTSDVPPVPVLTGSIGSGKSAASAIFETLGITIIDADLLSREVVEPGTEALGEITEFFGAEVLLEDGTLDRKKLAQRIFSNPEEKRELERIVHPRIRKLSRQRLTEAQQANKRVMLVIPLFFESGYRYKEVTHTIVVTAPRSICIERICKRDGITPELANKRFDSQLSPELKVKQADYVINNDSTLEHLRAQVVEVAKAIWGIE